MTTGTKIRHYRMQRKLKQEDMAEMLGITQRAYSKIESDEVGLKIERLEKIAQLLNVETQKLLPSNGGYNFENVTYSQIGTDVVVNQASDKERELFERIIKNQAEEIEYLKGLLNVLAK